MLLTSNIIQLIRQSGRFPAQPPNAESILGAFTGSKRKKKKKKKKRGGEKKENSVRVPPRRPASNPPTRPFLPSTVS